jgi:hypothetical protein
MALPSRRASTSCGPGQGAEAPDRRPPSRSTLGPQLARFLGRHRLAAHGRDVLRTEVVHLRATPKRTWISRGVRARRIGEPLPPLPPELIEPSEPEPQLPPQVLPRFCPVAKPPPQTNEKSSVFCDPNGNCAEVDGAKRSPPTPMTVGYARFSQPSRGDPNGNCAELDEAKRRPATPVTVGCARFSQPSRGDPNGNCSFLYECAGRAPRVLAAPSRRMSTGKTNDRWLRSVLTTEQGRPQRELKPQTKRRCFSSARPPRPPSRASIRPRSRPLAPSRRERLRRLGRSRSTC